MTSITTQKIFVLIFSIQNTIIVIFAMLRKMKLLVMREINLIIQFQQNKTCQTIYGQIQSPDNHSGLPGSQSCNLCYESISHILLKAQLFKVYVHNKITYFHLFIESYLNIKSTMGIMELPYSILYFTLGFEM